MPLNKKCWDVYGTIIRKKLFQQRSFAMTIPVETVKSESQTSESMKRLESLSFWDLVRSAEPGWDLLWRQGIVVDFDANSEGKVSEVTFRLERSRHDHLERIIEAEAV